MSNALFILGLILIPFDNLFFAPSAGWATVSPIIFSLYVVLNYRYAIEILLKYKKYFYFLAGIILYATVMQIINELNFKNLIDTLQGIILGIMIFLALSIRYLFEKEEYNSDLLLLSKAYFVSLIYGVIKFISLKFNVELILNFFKLIEKRYYDRVAFSFTEPSFTSMHLIGILLIILLFVKNEDVKKKYCILIVLFSIVMILSGGSTRFLLDICVAVFLVAIIVIPFEKFTKEQLKKIAIVSLVAVISMGMLLSFNNRVREIAKKGVYADASLASRYFRINATTKGFLDMPIRTFFGAGLGNVHIFMNSGYDEAKSEYKHPWTQEVDSLRNSKDNQLFCIYIRIIAEFGLVIFVVLIAYIIKLTKKAKINALILLLLGYLYIQFDSYAFYSLPLFVFMACYKINKLENIDIKENLNG